MQSPPFPVTSFFLGPNILLNTMFCPQTPSASFPPAMSTTKIDNILRNKRPKKNCAQSWLYFQDYTGMQVNKPLKNKKTKKLTSLLFTEGPHFHLQKLFLNLCHYEVTSHLLCNRFLTFVTRTCYSHRWSDFIMRSSVFWDVTHRCSIVS